MKDLLVFILIFTLPYPLLLLSIMIEKEPLERRWSTI